jgi:CPA2 family monovalent cation:H+ antiporter-2
MLVVAIDDREQATQLVRYVHAHHPRVYIVARAMDRTHVYELYAAGSRDIIRDTFDSAVRAGRSALQALGAHPYDAERQARGFVRQDQRGLRELAALYDPDVPTHQNAAYVARAKVVMAEQEEAMKGGARAFGMRIERGWMPPVGREEEAEKAAKADV